MRLSEFLTEEPTTPVAPAPAAQPAATAPVAAKPAGQQPFKPTQTMDPQQAAAANKAAQDFVKGLMAQLQQIKPVTESRQIQENWFTDKLNAAAGWVQEQLKANPLIELGLRLIPGSSTVLAIMDVVEAIRGGKVADATRLIANLVPGGQQIAQAIGVGQVAASGDISGAATQAANAAGLKDVSAGIQTAKAATSGDISGAAQTAANAAGLKDVSAGIQTAKAATSGDMAGAANAAGLKNVATGIQAADLAKKAMAETAELNRILKLSGMEFIAEDSAKSITVQRGDTLGRIAADNSTTVDALVKLNNIANPDRIYPGDVIKLPGGQGDPGGRKKRQGNTQIPDQPAKQTTTTSTGNPKIAMEFFLDQGWTPEQAAGLVANLQAESYDRIDPAADHAGAYGIAQWRGSRKRDFEQEMGMPLRGSSLMDQLKFVQHELNNKESKAGDLLKKATTAAEAAAIVDQFYERSGGAALKQRIAAAKSLLTAFA